MTNRIPLTVERYLVPNKPDSNVAPELVEQVEQLCLDLHAPNVFYEPWMLVPAIKHLGAGTGLTLICIRDPNWSNQLVGLFPLSRTRYHNLLPLSTWTMWGHSYCFRCCPLIRKNYAEQVWTEFLTWFSDSENGTRLLLLPDQCTADSNEVLKRVLQNHQKIWFESSSTQTAFLRTRPNADDALRSSLSSKSRSELRRRERRLSELGALKYIDAAEDLDISRAIDDFLELERSGWKGREGTALANDPASKAYFQEVISTAHNRNRLSFLCLYLDGQLIAARCELLTKEGGFGFKIAYDESFKQYSPGVLLEIEAIRRLHNRRDADGIDQVWSDSCSKFGSNPVYRFWPDLEEVHEFRIATGLLNTTVMSTLKPLATNTGHVVRSFLGRPVKTS